MVACTYLYEELEKKIPTIPITGTQTCQKSTDRFSEITPQIRL